MRRLALLLALPLAACSSPAPAPATAELIVNRDQRVGGPSAAADVGDFVLQNGRVRFGLLGSRCESNGEDAWTGQCSSPAPGLFGGSMADADLQRGNGNEGAGAGRDQFAELFASTNLEVTAVNEVEVLADGSAGGAAIVRAQGPAGNYISYIDLLGGLLDLPVTWQITDFILKPGDQYLTLRSHSVSAPEDEDGKATRPTEDPCGWVAGDDGLPCDGLQMEPATESLALLDNFNEGITQMGDFFFAGGDVDIFVPGLGFDEELQVVDYFVQGNNSFTDPFAFPFVAATGNGVSYAFGSGGTLSAPLFTSSLTAVFGAQADVERDADGEVIPPSPGDIFSYERYLGIGQGDVASALDQLFDAYEDNGRDMHLGRVTGRVLEESTMDPVSGISIVVYKDTGAERDGDGLPPRVDMFSQFATDQGQDRTLDGSFAGNLPAGDYLFVAKEQGRALSAPREVTVVEDGEVEVGMIVPRPGVLDVIITDERGRALPSKVTFLPVGATPPNRTDLGDPDLPGGFTRVAFVPEGSARLEVPAGRYDVFVTRGPEYSLWNSRDEGWPDGVSIQGDQGARLEPVLFREVDTTGFISADLHVHAVPSHDSGVPLSTRVATMVCEGVEYFVGTDHDVITDYRPVVDELGLNAWVQTSSGLETTTIEVGHFLGYPLNPDYSQPTHNGSIDWTAKGPNELIPEMRTLMTHGAEEGVVYVGHPRDGILGYFDQYGFDPFGAERNDPLGAPSLINLANPLLYPDPDATFTLDFDAIELLNGKRLDLLRTPTAQEMDCYFAQQNGLRFPGCSNLELTAYEQVERTMAEQEALEDFDRDFFLTREKEGQIDDWFTLLNLGFRHTAIGNSDTHGLTSTESGCPRNYIVSDTDDPEMVDERDLAIAVKNHKVVTSYGPLVRFGTTDGATVGDDAVATGGAVTLTIEVESPRWMAVDRVELYENGRLIREFTEPSEGVTKFNEQVEVRPVDANGDPIDAWYVVIAMGQQDLAPLYTPVEVPALELTDIVIGALDGLDLGPALAGAITEAAPYPNTHPVIPFALTNPIWVDVNGDINGDGQAFEPLGEVPAWFRGTPE